VKDKDKGVRMAVVDALSKIGDSRVLQELLVLTIEGKDDGAGYKKGEARQEGVTSVEGLMSAFSSVFGPEATKMQAEPSKNEGRLRKKT